MTILVSKLNTIQDVMGKKTGENGMEIPTEALISGGYKITDIFGLEENDIGQRLRVGRGFALNNYVWRAMNELKTKEGRKRRRRGREGGRGDEEQLVLNVRPSVRVHGRGK